MKNFHAFIRYIGKKLLVPFFFVFFINHSIGQDLYDIDTVRTIYLNFYDANWSTILDYYQDNNLDSMVLADLIVDGVTYDSVGVKYKGNSSYNCQTCPKKPFNVDINYVKDQSVYGYITLKLNSMFKDPACIREVLSYEILRNYMPASLCNWIVLYIDGNLHGVYTSAESINKDYCEKYYGSRDYSFFKCDPVTITGQNPDSVPPGCPPPQGISSSLIDLGTDTLCYQLQYEIKSDYGWTELVNMIQLLNYNTNQVKDVLNVDQSLWMHAFNNIFVNMDSYTGSGHNYYLYENHYDRFNTIMWDLNENFGVFHNGGSGNLNLSQMQQLDPRWNITHPKRPLISKLLSIPDYKKRYMAHYRTIINEFLANNELKNRAIELHDFIDPYIATDPNLQYTYADFQNNLYTTTGDVYGIFELMDARYTYLSTHPEVMKVGPTISEINQSISSPTSEDTVWITANITDVTQAFLHYKDEKYAPFVKVEMKDDGLHQDGAAGDGKFGAMIPPVSSFTVYYYIYAENNDAGKFSPERAEYVCYSYAIQWIPPGEIVINEFMASNQTSAQDPSDGNYPDWIELYNNTANPIDLSNWYLSDGYDNPTKYIFPANTIIPANDFVIIWADGDTGQSGLHTSFKLSAAGEDVVLSNAEKELQDFVSYSQQQTDISYGRSPNGTGNWCFMLPTFDTSNTSCISALNEYYADEPDITIYPNPFSDITNLRIENLSEYMGCCEFVLYDLLGREVFKSSIYYPVSSIQLNLPAGMYYLKVQTNKWAVVKKIVKL